MYKNLDLKDIIGVDEAGRGPLAGPVVAAAVILQHPIIGLTDSKKLSEKKRQSLLQIIEQQALFINYGMASVAEIDELNIHNATLLAMQRAVSPLATKAKLALIDGLFAPELTIASQTLVQGDLLHASISAASIAAKVSRDKLMLEFDIHYPEYGFAKHKGYGTSMHLQAINSQGPCPIHRKTFAPIKNFI